MCWQTFSIPLFEGFERVFFHHSVKKLVEVVCHTEYFYNFVFGDHSDYCL